MSDTEGNTHFLVWWRFRMACNRRPDEIWGATYFWKNVTCEDCRKARTPEMTDVDA